MSHLYVFLYRHSGKVDIDTNWFVFWFFLPIVIFGISIIVGVCRYYEIHLLKFYKYFLALSDSRKKILNDLFLYYHKLSTSEKKIFEKRMHHFLINKNFVSNDVEVTEEMKVLISAMATQILFGLEPYYLSNYNTIEITTEEPKNSVIEKSKRVIICWPSFKAGVDVATDGYNPGLKILSVAFNLEHQLNKYSYKMFNTHRFRELNQLYKNQAEKYIASGKSTYQDYKQVDRNEYFGVAVEYFFERPEHFYANQPEMYMALSRLLRQDPLGNYTYKKR
ncbi:zinc-dependent peptidase [uncultured Cytophaga sp.]|uniref:zinc-dependent peptidase n=1 Tax=uncultured Cytophaga sp. TaxID=160238 RepID=UPI0026378981|nr:zinc-dependent peptidase [uncultured Cytophaga sp.]